MKTLMGSITDICDMEIPKVGENDHRGILTKGERELFVDGRLHPRADLSDNQLGTYRGRIRRRVINAIIDFNFIEDLPNQDYGLIFDNPWRNGPIEGDAVADGVDSMLDFLALGLMENIFQLKVERAIERAATRHLIERTGNYADFDADISVSRQGEPLSPETVAERIESGDADGRMEYFAERYGWL